MSIERVEKRFFFSIEIKEWSKSEWASEQGAEKDGEKYELRSKCPITTRWTARNGLFASQFACQATAAAALSWRWMVKWTGMDVDDGRNVEKHT